MQEINTTILNKRNVMIPTTIFDCQKEKAPLVIYVHGFKANRFEDGRFNQVAQGLDVYGISVGFAGCDQSSEDFINYNLDNCLDDIECEYQYMLEHYNIDKEHLALVGYSMGGRLISIFSSRHPEFKTMAFWAGATYDQNKSATFIGENLNKMLTEIKEKGTYTYLNDFDGQYITISKKLVDNMLHYVPTTFLKDYQGKAIVIHGDKDVTVDYKIGQLTYASLEKASLKKFVTIKDANHGFGAWDNHPEQSNQLVTETISFFRENI